MIFLKKYCVLALFYFFIIALFGVILRAFPVFDININYKHLAHTHSHIALLGWVYSALMALIYYVYLKNENVKDKFVTIFWFTQITIIGMLFTFPFTGYALFSILFSTLFIIASYLFSRLVFKHTPVNFKQTHSYKCICIALWYMIVSSLGPWTLGIIMNTLGNTSSWYRNAIYFYLHFQYNGWFILALFGVFFYILELKHFKISKLIFNWFFYLFNTGVILTFGISILWMEIDYSINIISALGGLFQIVAIYILINTIFSQKKLFKISFSSLFKIVLIILFICLGVKLIMQLFGTFTSISKAISYNIDFIIGYIHWVFLGFVSIALLGFLNYFKLIKLKKSYLNLYIIGFTLTEVIIFYKGLAIWLDLYLPINNLFYIFISSALFFTSIALILVYQFRTHSG